MADINICFPSSPLSPREVDPEYLEDAHAFAALGAGILVWSMDEPGAKVRASKGFSAHYSAPVAWRGWMMSSGKYLAWLHALQERVPRYSLAQYEMHHRMRHWIPVVSSFTPKTWFIANPEDASAEMFPCHVKDGVKSANASGLPRPCKSVADVVQHKEELVRQRGDLDDGLVLRKHVHAYTNETRVWVFGSTFEDIVHQPLLGHPSVETSWIQRVLAHAPPEFFDAPFTIDIAQAKGTGELFVMDVGDAGVSDYKVTMTSGIMDNLRARWYAAMTRGGPQIKLDDWGPGV